MRFIPGHIGIAVAVLAVAAAQPAPAQPATEAARTLVETISPPAAAEQQLDRQIADMRSGAGVRAMLATNPRLRAELAKNSPAVEAGLARMGAIQAEAMEPILREMQQSARAAQTEAFAENFSAGELQEITTFYRTPTGAKLLARQAAISAEVASANREKFRTRLHAAEQSVAPKLDQELRRLFPDLAPGK